VSRKITPAPYCQERNRVQIVMGAPLGSGQNVTRPPSSGEKFPASGRLEVVVVVIFVVVAAYQFIENSVKRVVCVVDPKSFGSRFP
jgi:hypothetical protein